MPTNEKEREREFYIQNNYDLNNNLNNNNIVRDQNH